MPERHTNHGVLVGVDGSEHSLAAARWAGAEARARLAPLTLCRVVPASPGSGQYERQLPGACEDLVRARHQVEPDRDDPGIDVEELVVAGTASHELIELSRSGDLVVVGSRGRGGFAGLLLGSVSDQVATHSPGTVVVVRPHLASTDAPIFVGVDDTPGAVPALGYAFATAARDDRSLVAVHGYPETVPGPELGYLPVTYSAHAHDRAEAFLDRILDPWCRRFPDVTVLRQVTRRRPAVALCEASEDAHLVVVGATGRPLFAGLLGAVTRRVLHHATCPVVVAR